MILQPISERDAWLSECEAQQRLLEQATAPARTERLYHVTRNGLKMLWSESLVRHFLAKHEYRKPESWLECFGRGEGSYTDFGWVQERKATQGGA